MNIDVRSSKRNVICFRQERFYMIAGISAFWKISIIRKKKEVEGREKRALAEAGFAMYILSRPVDIDVYMH